jgi:SAM-dependent methyltransferase
MAPTEERAAGFRERLYESYLTGTGNLAPSLSSALAPRAPYLRRLVRRHFPPDPEARILDLGCGWGPLLAAAQAEGYRKVQGVDRSPEQVAQAARFGIGGVREGELQATVDGLAPASLDVVLTLDVIEHLTRDEVFRLSDGLLRALVPGGRWIVHVPNGESPLFGRVRYGDLTHELAFTRASLQQMWSATGFRDWAFFEDTPVVHGVRSACRRLIWEVLRAGWRLQLAAESGSASGAIFTQNLLAIAIR